MKISKSEQSEQQLASGRRALRVLRVVHELHKQGYQLIRIFPGMSASGCYWRCGISTAANMCRDNGAFCAEESDEQLVAKYSSGQENEYFGWKDAINSGVEDLAEKFKERFPRIVTEGRGRDWAYVGWYVEMLGFAERDEFPIAYADWQPDPRRGYLPTLHHWQDSELPLPPAGLAEKLCGLGYCR